MRGRTKTPPTASANPLIHLSANPSITSALHRTCSLRQLRSGRRAPPANSASSHESSPHLFSERRRPSRCAELTRRSRRRPSISPATMAPPTASPPLSLTWQLWPLLRCHPGRTRCQTRPHRALPEGGAASAVAVVRLAKRCGQGASPRHVSRWEIRSGRVALH